MEGCGQENKYKETNKEKSTSKITVRSAKKTGEAKNWERFTILALGDDLRRLHLEPRSPQNQ